MFYNENLYYLLGFCTNLLSGRNVSQKLKVDWKGFGGACSKMSMADFWGEHDQKWVWPFWWWDSLKFSVFEEWQMEYINKFFCMLIHDHKNSKLIKIFLGEHGQKWVWPVWPWGSKMNRWNKVICSYWYEFRKAKSWFNYFWVGMVKKGHGFLFHETLISVVRMNLWIELIFWMLIVMQ